MLATLKQVYGKHSPTFLISLCPLIFSLTLLLFHHPLPFSHCPYTSTLSTFQLTVAIVMASELILKSLGLTLIYKCSRQLSTTFYTVLFFVFLFSHAGLWVWAGIIFVNEDFRSGCKDLGQHYFFLKLYVLVVAGIFAILALMIIVLALPAVFLTIKSFRNRNSESS